MRLADLLLRCFPVSWCTEDVTDRADNFNLGFLFETVIFCRRSDRAIGSDELLGAWERVLAYLELVGF